MLAPQEFNGDRMSYTSDDCRRARQDFPALSLVHKTHPVAFLDGPGGTQVPQVVIDTLADGYRRCNVNVGGTFATSLAVMDEVARARQAVADFLGAASPQQISFGANMTSLNFALSRAIGRSLTPGDEIVITALDHEANRGPWLKLAERGVRVREVAISRDGTLAEADILAAITPRTRVVALGLASNALGTVTAASAVRVRTGEVGALLVCDAVHYAAHFAVDVQALDCDFLLCSAYKFYGPHIGILYSRSGALDALDTDCLRTQKQDAPYRIETGTLNHPALMGVTAAVDYLAGWGSGATRRAKLIDAMTAIAAYEHTLAEYYWRQVQTIPGVTLWGPPFDVAARAPTVSITLDGVTATEAAQQLADDGLQIWQGHFYALRVLESFDLVDRGGLLRTGLALYNTRSEIDRLLLGIEQIARRVRAKSN